MTTGTRFVLPYITIVTDDTGEPIPGARLFFYYSGTSTPLNTYVDIGLTTPNANPVQANASGTFPSIFMTSAAYKVVLTDSEFNQIWTADPVNGILPPSPPTQRAIRNSGDLPIRSTDQLLNIGITVNLAITVPLANTRAGQPFTFKNLQSSTAVATLSPTSPDEFDALTSIQLAPGQAITFVPANDGVNSGYMIE